MGDLPADRRAELFSRFPVEILLGGVPPNSQLGVPISYLHSNLHVRRVPFLTSPRTALRRLRMTI